MDRKDHIDAFGATSLILFSVLLAINHVIIKIVNTGLQPVFTAGLRSLGGIIVLTVVFRLMGRKLTFPQGSWPGLIFIGAAFSLEFVLLFVALDLTTVGRTSVIFYSMPVWMAIGAHFLIPGERMGKARILGLALAMAGVAWAILDRPTVEADLGSASLLGDFLALGASIGWAAIGLGARVSSAREAAPEVQLMVQLTMSAVVLLFAAQFFGPFVREPDILTWLGLGFQIFIMASMGFLFWLWLLKIYPASSVASFSFLAPLFGVFFGWLILDEHIGAGIIGSLALVAVGLVLINWRPRKV